MTSISQQSTPTRAIKRRPKLDASAIALIVHYIEQVEKTTPKKRITWTELETRFNYSRQALEKHESIKSAYHSTNRAAAQHGQDDTAAPNEETTPKSWTELTRQNARLRQERKEQDDINKKLLRFVVDLAQKSREKGVSIADIPLDLPAEYKNPIFSMDKPLLEKLA